MDNIRDLLIAKKNEKKLKLLDTSTTQISFADNNPFLRIRVPIQDRSYVLYVERQITLPELEGLLNDFSKNASNLPKKNFGEVFRYKVSREDNTYIYEEIINEK